MIRVLLMLILPLALPYLIWKAWRLFGPAAELENLQHPVIQPGTEPPWMMLALIGVVLVAITLTYLVLTSDGVPAP